MTDKNGNGAELAGPLGPVLREANALLGATRLHGRDARWLNGDHADVMVTPLGTGQEGGQAIVLTVVPRWPLTGGFGGTSVEVTDSRGRTERYGFDDDGHARVPVPDDFYRLVLQGGTAPLPASASRRARRRRDRAPLVTAAAAAVLAAVAATSTLFLGGQAAVATVGLSPVDCRNTTGRSTADHVVVAAVWGGKEKERFREVLEQFEEKTRFDVTFATDSPESDRDIGSTLNAFVARGCPPDVALLPQPGLLRELAHSGNLRPIDDIAGDLVRDNYSRGWQAMAKADPTVDGPSYGVWFKAANKSIIWYNVNAFRKAGIAQPPKDWQELKAAAARLHDVGIAPFSVGGEDGWTLTDWFENVYLRMWGADAYRRLADHETAWTDPTVTMALNQLAEIFGPDGWVAGGAGRASRTSYERSVKQVFADPEEPAAAMVFEGDFVATEIARTRSELGDDANFFPFPTIDMGAPQAVLTGAQTSNGEAVGGDVAVLMNGRDTPAARALLRFLAGRDAARPWAAAGGFASPNRNVTEQDYRYSVTRPAARQLADAERVTFDLSDLQNPRFGADRRRGMWPILREFLLRPGSAAETARQLEAAWRP